MTTTTVRITGLDMALLREIVNRWRRTGGGTIVPLDNDKRLHRFNRLAQVKAVTYFFDKHGRDMIAVPIKRGFELCKARKAITR